MRRLGLDIGTNSIGWCLIEDDAQIVAIGSRIFSDGRDPQSGTSLAVDRRLARSARRRRDRYIGRRSAFLEALVAHGLMSSDADEAKLIAARDPYEFRARSLSEPLRPYEIGRALFHLNQRRGFKSNRKAERKGKDQEDGKIAAAAQDLDRAMADAGADTLGQFLHGLDTKRVRMNSESQAYDFYPQRRHYEHEFTRIWETQAAHHPALLTDTAKADLSRILFFQRPLRAPTVGVCTFVTTEERLPKAHPLFQERRLYEEVNQLEITTPGGAPRKLTLDERNTLILKLRSTGKAGFDGLARLLKLKDGQSFNKASQTRTHMAGDEVFAVMSDNKRFGKRWAHFDADRQWQIIHRLREEEDPERLQAFLTVECGLDDEQAAVVGRAPLPEGHGRLGETASRRILALLRDGHNEGAPLSYNQAVAACGWHHSDFRTGECLDRLPYYGELLTREIPPGSQQPNDPPEVRWGKITNPTVHIGLRQLEKLVNSVIDVHGRPDEIVVELARELKLNETEKEEHERRIRRDTTAAIARGQRLAAEGFADTGANRALLRIWEEANPANPLDRRCPYCGQLVSLRALFSGEVDVDHILPYSRTLDDGIANKVVAHRSCNRAKGNRTPFERWGSDGARWEIISAEVARMHRSKQWRFGPDAMERFEREGGFIARQLTDTQYLSRLAGRYLSALYPSKDEGSVYVIPGRMTAMLRRLWGLNSLLPDHNFVENEHSAAPKNRLDHRHHAIDAAVVAVTTRGLMQTIARAAGRAEDKDLDRLFEGLPQPWDGFREELGMSLAAITVSHKPDHGRKGRPAANRDMTAGRLHNDTAYGFTGAMSADGTKPIVVHRVPFNSLKPADLANPDRIADQALREQLQAAVGGLTGKDFEAALARFARHDAVFSGIRRVRVREPLNVIPIRDRGGRIYKGHKGDSNARFDVWRLPKGKWVTDIVSMFDAHQREERHRPHPAAKKILSLRQNDIVAVERDSGPRELLRVVKFSADGTIVLAPPNEGGALKARDAAPRDQDPFKYVYSSAGGLKKLKARQVRVDPLGRVFDPGPRE
jgi:CRISPR-associated endonuclease Csn1